MVFRPHAPFGICRVAVADTRSAVPQPGRTRRVLLSVAAACTIAAALPCSAASAHTVREATTDAAAFASAPTDLLDVVGQWIPRDETGLIGRNASWGELVSPRFQTGSGRALRVSLAAGSIDDAQGAFAAMRAGTAGIDPLGRVVSSVPPDAPPGSRISPADEASAAAFFLGDACAGWSALDASDRRDDVATGRERASVRRALSRAIRWLSERVDLLHRADATAPNRLLFDALAFRACGQVAGEPTLQALGDPFVDDAIALQHRSGYYREGGGWDTGYQAVALAVGSDIMIVDPQDTRLERSLVRGATWLAERIDRTGRIDSTGNARTCTGGEVFLGQPKLLPVHDVIWGLVYLGSITENVSLTAEAGRVADHVRSRRDDSPCWTPND